MATDPVRIGERRAEIYTYESQSQVYGMNWSVRASHVASSLWRFLMLRDRHRRYCAQAGGLAAQNRRDKKFRLAVASFNEEYNNYVEIITRTVVQAQ